MHFDAFFNHYYGSIFEIALRICPLFSPYIAHKSRANCSKFDFVTSLILFALFLKSLIRSRNQGLLKSEEQLSDLKERCAQLC